MPRLFAPWMPCPTRPGAGCFTVCELTFFGLSSGVGQGRRSMCRPWPGGLAPQVRGGGFPRGNPCPRAHLCGLAAGPAVPCCGAVPSLRRVGKCPPFLSRPPAPPEGQHSRTKRSGWGGKGANTQQRSNGHKGTGQRSPGASKPPKAPPPCRSQGGPPSPKPGGGRAEDKR